MPAADPVAQIRKPRTLAWPTFIAFCLAWGLLITGSYMGYTEQWPLVLSLLLNSIAAFLAFSVMHEASHDAISKHRLLNDGIGQGAMLILTPLWGLPLYRKVHERHHLWTNQSLDKDPDVWIGRGPRWLLPLKWAFVDTFYFLYYARYLASESRSNTVWLIIANLTLAASLAAIILTGWLLPFLLYVFLPVRIASLYLAWSFAYLPHHPHTEVEHSDPYHTTNIRIGHERWLSWLFMGHNYHLIHHLYPDVPFYLYREMWQAKREELLKNPVKQVDAMTGRAL